MYVDEVCVDVKQQSRNIANVELYGGLSFSSTS
jgi:hypothetical protein